MEQTLVVTSPAFLPDGKMPKQNTGFGEDASPALHIEGMPKNTVSLAITLDDLDIPFLRAYNHWAIWNIPAMADIPAGIPAGEKVLELNGAVQGMAYGKHRYRGPKQPPFIKNRHRYRFTVYALDTALSLSAAEKKPALLRAMKGHVLASGSILGTYRRGEED